MNSESPWAESAQQLQQIFGQSWAQALQSFQKLDLGTPAPAAPAVQFSPAKLQALQQQYLKEAQELWAQGLQGTPQVKDKRFSGDAWASNPVAAFSAAAYLLNARTLMGLADAVEADEKTRARIRFGVEQWMAAMAPSNFLAFNAEAQKRAIETKGESIAKGIQNLLHDITQGHVSMTDETLFEVGRNVATTEGAVVYENEFFQLIEYKPLTAKVYERPFLLVPPCINKYYILDLQPENSFIRHAVEQGHRTFVVSWRNPDDTLGHKTWDDYVEDGAMAAIDVVRSITGAGEINALGFCVGGTILSNALAVLAARGEEPVASATFLTTLIDFSQTGVLDVFIDEDHEADFMAWLTSRGYRVTEDWRPVRVQLSSPSGQVDVHAMRLDPAGNGVQQGLDGEVYLHPSEQRVTGLIDGQAVVVASAERARELRSGYPPRAVDLHDLAVLDEL